MLEKFCSSWFSGYMDADDGNCDATVSWTNIGEHSVLAEYNDLSVRRLVIFSPSRGAAFIAKKQVWRKIGINPEIIIGMHKADRCIRK